MKNKAYIVANEQQEHNILKKFEQEGLRWQAGEKPTKWKPVKEGTFCSLPYALVVSSYVSWLSLSQLTDEDIVYDGRKEEHMSEKYVVSQEFMNELEKWKLDTVFSIFVSGEDLSKLPNNIIDWWCLGNDVLPDEESNNRLIAIIRWVNGEDVFEVEKPKKWVVRSKEPQGSVDGEPLYIWFVDELTLETETEATMPPYIRRFNTKEEAQSWANAHQEVVEVVDV